MIKIIPITQQLENRLSTSFLYCFRKRLNRGASADESQQFIPASCHLSILNFLFCLSGGSADDFERWRAPRAVDCFTLAGDEIGGGGSGGV